MLDKHTEDGQRTMHNVHGSDVKTRKAEKIDLFTNAKLGTRAVPRDPAKSRLFRDLLNAIRRPPMPPASLASALTPNTNNDNKNGVYRRTKCFVKLPILSYCPVMYDIVKIFQIVRFLLDIFQ